MYNLEHTYTINGNQINLSTCYHITPLLMITNLNENFFIPTPDAGTYVVNLTIYSSLTAPACDYSTIQDTRTLSNANFNFSNADIQLFPNPTNGPLQIEIGNLSLNSIKFYDTIGKLVKVSNDLNSNISDMQNGIYYVVLETETGTVTKKIILQK